MKNKSKVTTDGVKHITINRTAELGIVTKVLGIVIVMLILALVIQKQVHPDNNAPTFTSFMYMLQDMPTVSIPFISIPNSELGDWGLFNFLRDFFYLLIQVVNVGIFLINGVISICTFVVYFVGWLFA